MIVKIINQLLFNEIAASSTPERLYNYRNGNVKYCAAQECWEGRRLITKSGKIVFNQQDWFSAKLRPLHGHVVLCRLYDNLPGCLILCEEHTAEPFAALERANRQ